MSLVVQMADDLNAIDRRSKLERPMAAPSNMSSDATRNAEALPLFAAAEQLHARSRAKKRWAVSASLIALTAVASIILWKDVWQNNNTLPALSDYLAETRSTSSVSSVTPAAVSSPVSDDFALAAQTVAPLTPTTITAADDASQLSLNTDTQAARVNSSSKVESLAPSDHTELTLAKASEGVTSKKAVAKNAEANVVQSNEPTATGSVSSTVVVNPVVIPATVVADKKPSSDSIENNRFVKTSNRLVEDQQLFDAADTELKQQRPASALALLSAYFEKLTPAQYDGFAQSGSLYVSQLLKQREYSTADKLITDFRTALPDSPVFAKHEIRLRMGQQRYEEAQQLLRQSVAQNSTDSEFLAFQATIYQHQKSWGLAAAAYQQLLQKHAHRSDYWMGLAVAYDAQRKSIPARNAYQQAVALGRLSTDLERYAMSRIAVL